LIGKDARHFAGDIGILTWKQLVRSLQQCHLNAEEREHRSKLAADVSTTQNDQSLRQPFQLQDRLRRPDPRLGDASQIGDGRRRPSVDHDIGSSEQPDGLVASFDLDGAGRDEAGGTQDEVHARVGEHLFVSGHHPVHNGTLVPTQPIE